MNLKNAAGTVVASPPFRVTLTSLSHGAHLQYLSLISLMSVYMITELSRKCVRCTKHGKVEPNNTFCELHQEDLLGVTLYVQLKEAVRSYEVAETVTSSLSQTGRSGTKT
jgi:hypothetical protein